MPNHLTAGLVLVLTLPGLSAWAADSPIAAAALKGDKAAVRTLIKDGADVNAASGDGTTALHWAVRADDVEMVDALVRAKANVNAKDPDGVTPLAIACANANPAMIRKLLAAGADANTADPAGETVLMIAARMGNVDGVKALLDAGAQVNAKDTEAGTALMVAVRANHAEVVKFLIDRGAEVDAATRVGKTPARRPPNAGGGSHGAGIVRGGWPDRGYQEATPGGMTALLYAARDGRLEIVRMLLAAGADLKKDDVNKISPFAIAITNDQMEVAQFLLERGADINERDNWGRTPLWEAVEMRNLEMDRGGRHAVNREAVLPLIQALVAHGADVNARTAEVPPLRRFLLGLGDLSWVDFTGQTPFLRAALSGDVAVMKLLLEHGADPNIPSLAGSTALMAAAGVNWMVGQTYTESKEHLMEAVQICLDRGADVNAENSMGLRAIFGAVNRGSDDIVQFLVDKGARIDVKDKENRTLMMWAEGMFLETNPPERKPSTIALLEKLQEKDKQKQVAAK
jgi:ankyrin repeat protein